MGILTDDMQRIVLEQRLGFVATVCPDGTPNLSPKGTATVWDDDHLVFADLASPGTVGNLRSNPWIEINVVDPVVRKGYRFKGTAKVIERGPVFDRALEVFANLPGATERIRSVVIVRVSRALSLTSPAYDFGLTEEDVARSWERHYGDLRAIRERRSSSGSSGKTGSRSVPMIKSSR